MMRPQTETRTLMKRGNTLAVRPLMPALTLAMTLMLPSAVTRAADSTPITFNINVLAMTCTVAATANIPFGNVSGPDAIGHSWRAIGGVKPLTVTLSNCNPTTAPTGTPRITLNTTDPSLANSSNKLFRGATSGSTGFGIGIYNKASPAADSAADLVAKGTAIYTGTANTMPQLTHNFSAGVMCGTACAVADLAPGGLTATVTFNFSYN